MQRNSKSYWVESKEELNSLIVGYYWNLFKKESKSNLTYVIESRFPSLTIEQNIKLTRKITKEEIKKAIFVMGVQKHQVMMDSWSYSFKKIGIWLLRVWSDLSRKLSKEDP